MIFRHYIQKIKLQTYHNSKICCVFTHDNIEIDLSYLMKIKCTVHGHSGMWIL